MNKLRVGKQREYFLCSILAIFYFFVSYVIAPYHTSGDQIYYTKAYDLVQKKDLFNASIAYLSAIYSSEPIHFFLIWIFSNIGVEKNILMAFSNSILSVLFTKYLFTKTNNILIVFTLVITSYYLYTFFFTLEKLKFSVIFILCFLVYNRRIFLLLSLLTHFQMIITIFVFGVAAYVGGFTGRINFKIKYKIISRFILANLIAFIIFILYFDYALSKLSFYISQDHVGNFISLIPTITMSGYLWIVSDLKKSEIFCLGILVCIFIFLIGPERINMIMYFSWIYYWPQKIVDEHKAVAFITVTGILSCYWTYKSIIYLKQVIYLGG